jgi:hypothetical protein
VVFFAAGWLEAGCLLACPPALSCGFGSLASRLLACLACPAWCAVVGCCLVPGFCLVASLFVWFFWLVVVVVALSPGVLVA